MVDVYISILALITALLSFILSCLGFINTKRSQTFAVQEKKQIMLNEFNSLELLLKKNIRRSDSLIHDLKRIKAVLGEHEKLKEIHKRISDFKLGSNEMLKNISFQRGTLKDVDDTNYSKHNLEKLMALFNNALSSLNDNKTLYIDWDDNMMIIKGS